jgi:hypothetical protein
MVHWLDTLNKTVVAATALVTAIGVLIKAIGDVRAALEKPAKKVRSLAAALFRKLRGLILKLSKKQGGSRNPDLHL